MRQKKRLEERNLRKGPPQHHEDHHDKHEKPHINPKHDFVHIPYKTENPLYP